MTLADLRAAEQARVDSYLAGPRNLDLPELVRRWIAEGEGAEQDEFIDIDVSEWRERSSFDTHAAPFCVCCGNALPEGGHRVRVQLAESATCFEVDETIDACRSCAEDWIEASNALERRTGPNRIRQALAHLTSAQSQMLDSDDAIIRGHIDAAVKLLAEAS